MPRWRLIGQSVRGASHERSGAPNQDAFRLWPDFADAEQLACAVADGHGGKKYFRSHLGAQFASELALKALRELCPKLKDTFAQGQALSSLPGKLSQEWLQAVEDHRQQNPATPEEARIWTAELNQDLKGGLAPVLAYGSTVLAVAVHHDEMLFLQLGDGDILLVSDTGEVIPVFPPEADLLGGETTSLVSPDAPQRMRLTFWNRPEILPAIIMVSTDGYSNSYPDAASFHQVASDIWEMTAEGNWDKVKETLPAWLTETTRKGSGDDITAVLIARSDV